MTRKVSELNEESEAAFSAFLLLQDDALLYASNCYRHLLRSVLGASDRYLYVVDNQSRITSVLPAFVSRPGKWGPVLNSLPFYGSNGGIVGPHDSESARVLTDRFYEIARETKCISATIISSPLDSPEMDAWYRNNLEYDAIDERMCQMTPLSVDSCQDDRLIASFHQKTRNMVRKAEKVRVEVSVENEMLDFVQEVHTQNMQAIGGIAKSRRFFSMLPRYFKPNDDFKIYVARIDGEPVAAVLLFYFNKTVEYFTPVIRAEFRTTQALSGAIFRAMSDASKCGFRWWNWGGTWATQESVYLFKKRWGAKDLSYRYFVKLYDKSLAQRSREEILAEYSNFYVLPFTMLGQGT